MSPEKRLFEMGLELPRLTAPSATFLRYKQVGNLLYLSGQGARDQHGALLIGKLGRDIDVEEGYRRARTIGLQLLAAASEALGSLDRVVEVVKVFGMVNAEADFVDHPAVINGCSDLLVEVFGEAGRHARSAVGMGSLPAGISVEIEAIFAVR